MRNPRTLVAIGVALAIIASSWSTADPQGQADCELEVVQTPGMRTHYVTLADGTIRIDAGGGVEATCGPKWIRADSASWYRERGELYLFENVRYREGARTLTSRRATYYESTDRVRAEGDVVLTDEERGSKLTGPLLNYYPRTEARPFERIFAPQRPHLTFYPEGGDQPFDVDADRMHIYGDSLIAGAGRVVALRADLEARGDSMDLSVASERLWLLGDPRVDASEMTLRGDSILMLMEAQQVREIQAWPRASATGEELSLTAPLLRMFVGGEEISRTVAAAGDPARTGVVDSAGREPWAASESTNYRLVADSIDILRPEGVLDRVIAVRRARATARQPRIPGDTLLGTDWMVGDTITGFFAQADSAAVGDPQLQRLEAAGAARALYHMRQEEQDTTARLAINYVIGRSITLWLEAGEVQEARVVGPALGLYNEPAPLATNGDSAAVAADSADTVKPDTSSTGKAPPDTISSKGGGA